VASTHAVVFSSGRMSVTRCDRCSAPRPARMPARSPSTDLDTDIRMCGDGSVMPLA
jgi:hypothetical protein